MLGIPMLSLETMMQVSVIMGGMLFCFCSLMFAVDVWSLMTRKVWKKKHTSSLESINIDDALLN